MTEVLSVHDMEFSPGQNMIVSLEPNELLRSPSSSSLISSLNTQNEHMDLSVLAVLIAAFRRTGLACQVPSDELSMDIGWPTNVRHIAHVTFDRFNGFLGLPAEFQTEIPRRVPSASVSVFGVSPESMQCSFDRKGNSVPTILLLLQERLYDQGGLKAEGIFRINAENSQEEDLRNQLNRGIVPYNIDVHCLAGLIKAWFRELPKGILDSLSPEQVMQCHTEEQTLTLVKTLPPMQSALLDWGVDLMADVVQEEYYNKMNVHNIAMVFAPNMSQMVDPLTALMHAVQVMNLLKMLILKTLRERKEALLDPRPGSSCTEPPSGNERDNTPTGTSLLICGPAMPESHGQLFQAQDVFLRSPNNGKSINDSEHPYNSLDVHVLQMDENEEDGLSSDSHGPYSNGFSSMIENTDDDSNSTSPDDFTEKKDTSLCTSMKMITSADGSPCVGGDIFCEIFGKMQHLSLENEDGATVFEDFGTIVIKQEWICR